MTAMYILVASIALSRASDDVDPRNGAIRSQWNDGKVTYYPMIDQPVGEFSAVELRDGPDFRVVVFRNRIKKETIWGEEHNSTWYLTPTSDVSVENTYYQMDPAMAGIFLPLWEVVISDVCDQYGDLTEIYIYSSGTHSEKTPAFKNGRRGHDHGLEVAHAMANCLNEVLPATIHKHRCEQATYEQALHEIFSKLPDVPNVIHTICLMSMPAKTQRFPTPNHYLPIEVRNNPALDAHGERA